MRVYNGHIHEGDFYQRHGYYPRDFERLKECHPDIQITWFPVEQRWSACLPSEGYTSLGGFCQDKMECLQQAIELKEQ